MKKPLGIILTVLGLIGLIYFGIKASQDSESISLGELDIAVSSADWTPVIISGVLLLIGLFVMFRK